MLRGNLVCTLAVGAFGISCEALMAADMLLSVHTENAVRRYDPGCGGSFDYFVPAGSGGLNEAFGMVFGPNGNLFVNSFNTNQIMRYDGSTGEPLPVTGKTGAVFAEGCELHGPEGLAFGTDGDLYVCSIQNDQVVVFYGPNAPSPGSCKNDSFLNPTAGIDEPTSIVFGGDGWVYATGQNSGLHRYDAVTGGSGSLFASHPNCGTPHGLALGVDRNWYVGCAGTDNVVRFDAGGDYVDEYCGGNTAILEEACGVAFGPAGLLYVVGCTSNTVVRCDGSSMTPCLVGVDGSFLAFHATAAPTASNWSYGICAIIVATIATLALRGRRLRTAC